MDEDVSTAFLRSPLPKGSKAIIQMFLRATDALNGELKIKETGRITSTGGKNHLSGARD